MSRVSRKRVAAPDRDSKWTRELPWRFDAVEAGERVIRQQTEDLRDTAEQIARRAGAGTVSQAYVHRAAEHAGLHPPSAVADVLLGLGGMVFGAVLGVGGSLLVTPAELPFWAIILVLALGVVGSVTCTVGATLKLIRR